jgi:CubicO group peptidase (beta-lactamase class C family)
MGRFEYRHSMQPLKSLLAPRAAIFRNLLLSSLVALLVSYPSVPLTAGELPVNGERVAAFEPLDAAILKFMALVDARAATVAVAKRGILLYSQGYGFSDKDQKKLCPPDALMRIASVTKPITNAAIRNAIRGGTLSLDAKAFRVIDVKAAGGQPADSRILDITVDQLLHHQGGWDRSRSGDYMFRVRRIERELNLKRPAAPADVVAFMLTQPLDFAPGEMTAYSNFGYCVLGRVLEATGHLPYAECVRSSICKPLGIEDIKQGHSDSAQRDPREVAYPVPDDEFSVEVNDANGGLIASTPALCAFAAAYWATGEPRSPKEMQHWNFMGSLPGTTALVVQRNDEPDVAVLFNARRDEHFVADNDRLIKDVDAAMQMVFPNQALPKPAP